MSGSGDGRASSPPGGGRGTRPSHRVTLEFAGPPLALPGDEPTARPASDVPPAPLELGELEGSSDTIDVRATNDDALTFEPDEDETSVDGWGRLRSRSGAPARPRSLTPPALARDDALELVTRRSRPPSTPALDLAGEMADRYALGDYSGALRVAELLLGRDPEDPRAQQCAESSRERLLSLYTARLGSLLGVASAEVGSRVPRIAVPEHEIRWLGLDHRQGFLLSRLDGNVSVDDLVDVTGMSRLEVLRTLVELVESGAVGTG